MTVINLVDKRMNMPEIRLKARALGLVPGNLKKTDKPS